ncbi:uncharacterized protein [Hyperolius riggenbachi]|uniref:uncharacterized protein n=1 Tax=Hyperolius riggenbachi TaxID=752182 RepID=UPI0035A2AF7B
MFSACISDSAMDLPGGEEILEAEIPTWLLAIIIILAVGLLIGLIIGGCYCCCTYLRCRSKLIKIDSMIKSVKEETAALIKEKEKAKVPKGLEMDLMLADILRSLIPGKARRMDPDVEHGMEEEDARKDKRQKKIQISAQQKKERKSHPILKKTDPAGGKKKTKKIVRFQAEDKEEVRQQKTVEEPNILEGKLSQEKKKLRAKLKKL